MRRQLLDIAPIKPLARFDELKIMLFKFPSLYRFLLLHSFVAKLDMRSWIRRQKAREPGDSWGTHAREQLAESGVDLEMHIPEMGLDIGGTSGFEILEDGILAGGPESATTNGGGMVRSQDIGINRQPGPDMEERLTLKGNARSRKT